MTEEQPYTSTHGAESMAEAALKNVQKELDGIVEFLLMSINEAKDGEGVVDTSNSLAKGIIETVACCHAASMYANAWLQALSSVFDVIFPQWKEERAYESLTSGKQLHMDVLYGVAVDRVIRTLGVEVADDEHSTE